MDVISNYPEKCRKSIRRLVSAVGMSAETAYSLLLLHAALMDLYPEDSEVVEIILSDSEIYPEVIA